MPAETSWARLSPTDEITNELLERVLSTHFRISQFKGVWPCDLMPEKLTIGDCVILNTDPHTRSGNHYVAVKRADVDSYLYFDPLNLNMEIAFPRLAREFKKRRLFSQLRPFLPDPIQALDSKFCGLFCLNFILAQTIFNRPPKGYRGFYTDPEKLHLNDAICMRNIQILAQKCK